MKKTLLVLALAIATIANAQVLNVASVEKINLPENAQLKVAGISPDGSYILLTTPQNVGLQKFDLKTHELTIITEAEGAGYNAQVSADGAQVVYRETTVGTDRLRRQRVVRQSMVNDEKEVVVKETRQLNGYVIKGNTILTVNNRRMQAKRIGKEKAESAPVVSISNSQLMLTRNGQTIVLSPNGQDKSYIWPSVSPDETKICYYVCGDGAYVCDLYGKNVQRIAHDCRAAKWLDNNTIVAMADKDNGEVVVESSIVVYTLDQKMQVLTDPQLMTMYPYPSADGKHIVCTSELGGAYMINIQ